MSCHSTPGNLAVLGYSAGAYGLDSETVESEFHWLKRVGRDRQTPAPTAAEWQEFCDKQAQWIAHDDRLSEMRRAKLGDRITAARSDTPDGATYYALENLPARLSYVTDPATVHTTLLKVQRLTDQAAKMGNTNPDSLKEAVLSLRRAEALITRRNAPDAADLPDDEYSLLEEATEATEMLDIYLATPNEREGQASREHLYQAHRWIASALQHLKRRSTSPA